MNVIVIEDEKPAARRLKRMLQKLDIEVQVMLHSVEESLNWFQTNEEPDLIFLDIQLSDGLSFEIFEELSIHSAIIFTTAYDEYALKAFKLNSIDYLLKPIDEDELKNAVDKYHKQLPKSSNLKVNMDDIRKLLINPIDRKYKKRFTIKIGQHIKIIPTNEIECFYSENKGTYALMESGRSFLMEQTIESLVKELDPKAFFRISRKCIIQIAHIRDIVAFSNARLKIEIKPEIDIDLVVSRERVKDFKLWIS